MYSLSKEHYLAACEFNLNEALRIKNKVKSYREGFGSDYQLTKILKSFEIEYVARIEGSLDSIPIEESSVLRALYFERKSIKELESSFARASIYRIRSRAARSFIHCLHAA